MDHHYTNNRMHHNPHILCSLPSSTPRSPPVRPLRFRRASPSWHAFRAWLFSQQKRVISAQQFSFAPQRFQSRETESEPKPKPKISERERTQALSAYAVSRKNYAFKLSVWSPRWTKTPRWRDFGCVDCSFKEIGCGRQEVGDR
jgi:hypothetical protein